MDEEIRKKIEDLTAENQPRQLNPQEEREMQDGMALKEMTGTAGWAVLKSWLEAMSFHSWVDPRGTKKEDWEWQELNAFHAANTAKELIMSMEQMISRSDYLHKVKLGEVTNKRMRI